MVKKAKRRFYEILEIAVIGDMPNNTREVFILIGVNWERVKKLSAKP